MAWHSELLHLQLESGVGGEGTEGWCGGDKEERREGRRELVWKTWWARLFLLLSSPLSYRLTKRANPKEHRKERKSTRPVNTRKDVVSKLVNFYVQPPGLRGEERLGEVQRGPRVQLEGLLQRHLFCSGVD